MIDAAIIGLFHQVDSGQVSDAMEELALPRRVLLGLRRLGPATCPMVGPAFTMQQARKAADVPRSERRVRQAEVSRELAGAGQVVVIATGGITDIATWGENHALRCLQRGVSGMLTDGALRDVAAIERGAFPVYCRGASPVKSLWDLETRSIGEQVEINGVPIAPGDVIFADETGALVMAANAASDVARVAHRIRLEEQTRQVDLRQAV